MLRPSLDSLTEGRAVGQSPARLDGRDKVTGRALYLDDLTFPGQVFGRTVRSTVPHARLLGVRFDPAFDWSGITRVTAADIQGDNVVQLIADDQPFLARDVIRHAEEPVALLACADRERLEAALAHVFVDVEPLPPVLDPLRSEVVFKQYLIDHAASGLAEAFARADRVVEGTYLVRHQEQMYIEPNAVCAVPREDGGMTLHGSMQCPFYVHRALQRLLRVGEQQISVLQTVTGGGFGGKEEYPSMVAGHAALLARKSGRPVKMVYRRDEDVAATTKRHPAVMRHRTAVQRDGTLLACEIDVVMDGGAYVTLSPVVASRGVLHAAGAYRWPHARIACRVVQTNTPPNGAFRGFGVPQTIFAVEAQIEKIARELQLDPLEVRRRNALELGDETPTGQKLLWSVSARECLDAVAERSGYAEKRAAFARENAAPGARRKRGIGISLALHGAGFTGAGEAKLKARAGVELTPDGARVLSISTDIGQGTLTVFAQMAADALGLPVPAIEIAESDTSRMPDSGPTVASRTLMVVGGTIAKAAQALSRTLCSFAAEVHGAVAGDVLCENGVFIARGRSLAAFGEIARRWLAERGPLRVVEQYVHPQGIEFDEVSYRGAAYPCYGWSATAVELSVDADTAEVRLDHVVTACDVGKAVHPILAEGQIEGGTVQALGYALLEEVIWKDGRILNTRMQNYLIPTAVDVPHVETILVENPYPHGPYGAKGIGELPMDGPAPAVTAALLHATSALVCELPATPERILRAIDAAKAGR
ncbi:MAG TPA: xanthine dehydrogenase family protein molybdopterin-binding subunit [Myxococcales bacterium]|nr:xanthine dehydrogenase family protein molybdopterin-binding subunit [Myxococcales bacterium]